MPYPTAEQILAEPRVKYPPAVLAYVKAWKREFRGRRRTEEGIRALIMGLDTIYQSRRAPGDERPVTLQFIPGGALGFMGAAYNWQTRTITLDPTRLSVVSALHEYAHHLFGHSERKACRWSVHLFRRTFPRTFARAAFVGHRLVVEQLLPEPTRQVRIREEVGQMVNAIAATFLATGVTEVRFVDERTGETGTVIPVEGEKDSE